MKIMPIRIGDTDVDVHYWMEFSKPHVTKLVALDGRILSHGGNTTYQPAIELMILAYEKIITEEMLGNKD